MRGLKVSAAPVLMALACIAVASPAEARVCKPRIDAIGTGQGLFGEGTQNARAAAVTNFESKASSRFGYRYGSFANARGVRWDCKKNAILQAKCVVTASPCR
jgi:hypothetical protein